MRDLYESKIDKLRERSEEVRNHYGNYGDETCGAFTVPYQFATLKVIAATGDGWEHVSVSLKDRCPTWKEMDHIKRMFFKDDEAVMQLHVTSAEHIDVHPYTLHLWRPTGAEIPLPPHWMV